MKVSISFFLLLFLPCCSINKQEETNSNILPVEVYDLNASTNIIVALLKTNELGKILAESEQDQDKIDTLIKNFSPSEMAFESEVLNHENPVIILYFEPDADNQEIITKLTELAQIYKDTIKFVKIDNQKLFKITQHSEVDVFPTIMVIHNRNELGRLEKPNIESIKDNIMKILKSH